MHCIHGDFDVGRVHCTPKRSNLAFKNTMCKMGHQLIDSNELFVVLLIEIKLTLSSSTLTTIDFFGFIFFLLIFS